RPRQAEGDIHLRQVNTVLGETVTRSGATTVATGSRALPGARGATKIVPFRHTEEGAAMSTAISLKDITIHPVIEQQGPFFDALEFFPTLSKELLEENRAWLQPTFIDPVSGRLILCVQSFVIKTPHHNILVDSCVGNHKPRPARPFWNMMSSDRFEKGLVAAGLAVNDIDYVVHASPCRPRGLEHTARERALGADISQGEICHGRRRTHILDTEGEGRSVDRPLDH